MTSSGQIALGDTLMCNPSYGANYAASDWNGTDPRYLRITDIDDSGRLISSDAKSIPVFVAQHYLLEHDDIVIARTGNTVGKSYIHSDANGQIAYAGYLVRFRLDVEKAVPHFIFHYLHSPYFWAWVHRTLRIGAQPNINAAEYKTLPLPKFCPPEQRKIARILTTLDNLIEKTEALIAKYQAIKQGMMHDLFTRGVDSSGQLRPTQQQAPDLYEQTRFGVCPKSWKQTPLSEYAEVSGGVTLGRKLDSKSTIELPYLRVANVQDGYLDLGEMKTVEVLKSEAWKYKLEPGDVVMTEGGDFDKLGRGTIWEGQIADCLHQNHVFRVRAKTGELHSPFLAHLTGSTYGRHYFLMCAKQTTNLASINATQVKAFPLLLPSPEEQNAIIDKVAAIDGQIGVEQSHKRKLMKVKSGLMQDLLTGKVRVKVDEADEVAAHA